jgi:hypothetical protein
LADHWVGYGGPTFLFGASFGGMEMADHNFGSVVIFGDWNGQPLLNLEIWLLALIGNFHAATWQPIYLTFKYGNIKINLYLEEKGCSKMVA